MMKTELQQKLGLLIYLNVLFVEINEIKNSIKNVNEVEVVIKFQKKSSYGINLSNNINTINYVFIR